MSNDHDCGHTDDEQSELMAEVFAPENLSILIASMPNETLTATMQLAITELFIRAKDDENFVGTMRSMVATAEEVFVNIDEKFREHARKARTEFSVKVENEEFMQGAGAELASILEEHGVVPETLAPTTQPEVADDFWPGQYL